jgi:hypothetical protein
MAGPLREPGTVDDKACRKDGKRFAPDYRKECVPLPIVHSLGLRQQAAALEFGPFIASLRGRRSEVRSLNRMGRAKAPVFTVSNSYQPSRQNNGSGRTVSVTVSAD